MDFFDILLAKKLEDDRDPTIEGLSVTENGTYSEEGKAYNPVIVNVPKDVLGSLNVTENGTYTPSGGLDGFNEVNVNVGLPQNAYLLNTSIKADITSFSNGAALPMASCVCDINPIQEGSGVPSPQNVRPINGWTEANITVADATVSPTVSNTYNIEFEDSGSPLTVYGGTLDAVSGVLTVTGTIIDLGTLSYEYDSSGVRFYAVAPQLKDMNQWDGAYGYCSHYEKGRIGSGGATDGLTVGFGLYGMYVYIRDTRYSDVTSFREAMNGVQLVYELATPTIYQLTPATVKSILNVNNVWHDCNGEIQCEYFSK